MAKSRRRRRGREPVTRPRRRLPPLRDPTESVRDDGSIYTAAATAPKPDNWARLGLPRHPPSKAHFVIPEPAYWSAERLAPTFRSLLSMVRTKASRGIRLEVVYRAGQRQGGKRGTDVYFPPSKVGVFSRPFANAQKFYPSRTNAEAARRYLMEFLQDFELRSSRSEEGSYTIGLLYIMRLQVSLLFNKRTYRVPKAQSYRAWRKGYLERRREAKGKARAHH